MIGGLTAICRSPLTREEFPECKSFLGQVAVRRRIHIVIDENRIRANVYSHSDGSDLAGMKISFRREVHLFVGVY